MSSKKHQNLAICDHRRKKERNSCYPHTAITQLTPLLWFLCRTTQFLELKSGLCLAMQTSARHSSNFWLPFRCFYWVISWCHLLQFAKSEMRERKPQDQKKKSDYGYWDGNSSLSFPGFPFLYNFSASWCKNDLAKGSIYNWHFLILLYPVLINSTISCTLLYPSTPISPHLEIGSIYSYSFFWCSHLNASSLAERLSATSCTTGRLP